MAGQFGGFVVGGTVGSVGGGAGTRRGSSES